MHLLNVVRQIQNGAELDMELASAWQVYEDTQMLCDEQRAKIAALLRQGARFGANCPTYTTLEKLHWPRPDWIIHRSAPVSRMARLLELVSGRDCEELRSERDNAHRAIITIRRANSDRFFAEIRAERLRFSTRFRDVIVSHVVQHRLDFGGALAMFVLGYAQILRLYGCGILARCGLEKLEDSVESAITSIDSVVHRGLTVVPAVAGKAPQVSDKLL